MCSNVLLVLIIWVLDIYLIIIKVHIFIYWSKDSSIMHSHSTTHCVVLITLLLWLLQQSLTKSYSSNIYWIVMWLFLKWLLVKHLKCVERYSSKFMMKMYRCDPYNNWIYRTKISWLNPGIIYRPSIYNNIIQVWIWVRLTACTHSNCLICEIKLLKSQKRVVYASCFLLMFIRYWCIEGCRCICN